MRSLRSLRAPFAAALAAALLLAACGGDDSNAAGTDPDPSGVGAEPTSATSAFPVSVEHEFGTTVVESEPQRIVSVGYTEQDFLLALGVIPVGVTDWYGDQPDATWPWAHDLLQGAHPTVLSSDDGFDFEAIAALDPDLIIGTNAGIDETTYPQLSAIAPTIAHPVGANRWFSRWDDQARLIGQALGRADQMEAVISDVQGQFAEAADAHPEFAGTKVVFLQNAFYDGSAIAYQDGLSTEFLTDLGFVVPSELDPFVTEGGQAYIPMEQLGVLDAADALVWGTEAPSDRTALESEPLFQQLAAARSGALVFTDGITAGAIYFNSPLSLPYVLERMVPALATTVAGDGPVQLAG